LGDGLARATKMLRRKGGKKAGGQIGDCGEALDALAAAMGKDQQQAA
jgi:hypothetical protein